MDVDEIDWHDISKHINDPSICLLRREVWVLIKRFKEKKSLRECSDLSMTDFPTASPLRWGGWTRGRIWQIQKSGLKKIKDKEYESKQLKQTRRN